MKKAKSRTKVKTRTHTKAATPKSRKASSWSNRNIIIAGVVITGLVAVIAYLV